MNTASRALATYAAVLTTFNAEKTIERAVESILAQSISAAEIVIIDDASQDATVKILHSSFKHVSNLIIIVNEKNSGQSFSRNIAAQISTSELLIFFDDDDISHPQRAKEHLEMLKAGSDISYVSSVKKYSNSYEVVCKNEDFRVAKVDATALIQLLVLGEQSNGIGKVWIPASTSAIRRSFFLSIGGYDIKMRRLEDADIAVKAAQRGCSASWSPRILVTRTSTYSSNKGGTIEMDFEKRLVLKYQDLLTKSRVKRALKLIEIRRAYFSKHYIQLILRSCTSPTLLFGSGGKLLPFLKRTIHDRRQQN